MQSEPLAENMLIPPQQTSFLSPTPEHTPKPIPEIGGFTGPEPTRYGDWEKQGRCIDF